jgi:hypothetical protein
MFVICKKPLYLGPPFSYRMADGRETYDVAIAERFPSREDAQAKLEALPDEELWMLNMVD